MNRCNFCGKLFRKKYHNSNIFEQLICEDCKKEIIKKNLTLGIGILHYKESQDTVLRALKSIDNQKNICFSNIKVLVVTDEDGLYLNIEALNSKLKNIKPEYYNRKRAFNSFGCGGTRNTIIERLKTDYIMFLDSDDIFSSNKVLSKIYKKINDYKPEIYSSGVKEQLYNGKFIKYNNLMCLNMTHGKAFKREALLRYNIKFDEKIRVGEDLIFLTSLYNVCDNIYFDTKLFSYSWLYNFESITRNTGVDNKLDSYYRCFYDVMKELNDWYNEISVGLNNFVNSKFITMMYNIFYYRIMLTAPNSCKEYYLKKLFEYVLYPVDFHLSDKLDKSLNKKLLKHIEYFSSAYYKYKNK